MRPTALPSPGAATTRHSFGASGADRSAVPSEEPDVLFVTVERQNYERTSVTSSDAEVAAALGLSAASGELNAIDTSIKLTGKLDHNLGNNSQLVFALRLLRQHIPRRHDDLWKRSGPGLDHPSSFSTRYFTGHTAFAGWNHTMRGNMVNELRLRFNAFDDIRESPQDQPANVKVQQRPVTTITTGAPPITSTAAR